MEKLIELLNEYDPYIQSDSMHTDNFWWYVSQGHSAVFPKEVGVERIVSKQYGFIKWLVDNDKIDRDKAYILHNVRKDILTDQLLMLLAIKDEPIQFLISILK